MCFLTQHVNYTFVKYFRKKQILYLGCADCIKDFLIANSLIIYHKLLALRNFLIINTDFTQYKLADKCLAIRM